MARVVLLDVEALVLGDVLSDLAPGSNVEGLNVLMLGQSRPSRVLPRAL